MSLLVTRPRHEDTTNYAFHWAGRTLDEARKRSITVLDLHDDKATRENIESMIRKKNPSLIFFNGHGDERTIYGHKEEPLVEAGRNESILRGSVTYAITCRSGKILGPRSVEKGAVAYIGYQEDFTFLYDKSLTATPLKDLTAGLFLGPAQQPVLSLIKGRTVGEAVERTRDQFRKSIETALTSMDPGIRSSLTYLFGDLINLVSHGDQGATVKP